MGFDDFPDGHSLSDDVAKGLESDEDLANGCTKNL